MYGANINGMTTTVGVRAMTALKRDGTALIPASLVNVLKGTRKLINCHILLSACNVDGLEVDLPL